MLKTLHKKREKEKKSFVYGNLVAISRCTQISTQFIEKWSDNVGDLNVGQNYSLATKNYQ